MEEISIGTHRPSCNGRHLFKLFEDKISTIEPALGIELFILEAPKVEGLSIVQEKLFESNAGLHDVGLAELLDRIGGKIGAQHIHRYVPDEHYWPEGANADFFYFSIYTITFEYCRAKAFFFLLQPHAYPIQYSLQRNLNTLCRYYRFEAGKPFVINLYRMN